MRLLLDECMPRRLKREFVGHNVFTVIEAGFKGLQNGDLLRAASGEFAALITVDRKLAREHDLTKFKIAILVLVSRSNRRYEDLKPLVPLVLESLVSINLGEVIEVGLPR
jgi:Domain of unknown function (DUF5615)